jgi:short subunit dehydrogenase-like uncharacterized protein
MPFVFSFFFPSQFRKVLHASAVALDYGKDITIHERYVPLGIFWTRMVGILAFFPLALIQMGILCIVAIAKLPVLGKKLANRIAPAGSGPPDAWLELTGNSVYATVTAKDDSSGGTVDRGYAYISFKGDAGNLVTAQCVSESALALVFNRDMLPERSEDGFGTPAELLGNALLKRFKETKVRPVEIKTSARTSTPKNEMSVYIH